MYIFRNIKNVSADMKYYIEGYFLGKWNHVLGHQYINKSMTDKEWDGLSKKIYGNQYIQKQYMDTDLELIVKGKTADLILSFLPDIRSICDAGANRGYLMKAFQDRGIKASGFDILENKDLVLEDVRDFYRLGSILDIPDFGFGVWGIVSSQ